MPLHRWFKGGRPDDEGARLINVAASRAQDRLVLIGNLKHLAGAGSGPFGRLVDDVVRDGGDVSLRSLATAAAARLRVHDGYAVRNRAAELISRSTQALVWSSLPPRPSGAVMVALLDAAASGASLRLWCPEPQEEDERQAVVELRRNGIEVHLVNRVREDAVLTDDIVLAASGSVFAPSPFTIAFEHRGLATAEALDRLLARRTGWRATGDGGSPRPCRTCGDPMIRVETFKGEAFDSCTRCYGERRRARSSAPFPSPRRDDDSASTRVAVPLAAVCSGCNQMPSITALCVCS